MRSTGLLRRPFLPRCRWFVQQTQLGGFSDSHLRDDPRDVLGGRHVEGRISRGAFFWSDWLPVQMENFLGGPFLDWDFRPGSKREVDCARRCRDVEWDIVLVS